MKNKNTKTNIIKNNAITLISLIITIIILIILASVAIYLSLGNNGIFNRAKQAKEVTNKQEATDIINLKITTAQMDKYAEDQRMPTLKELSVILGADNEIQYVTEKSQVASTKYEVGENPASIFTKLNEYPYEFEINGKLQLASIDGVKLIADEEKENDKLDINLLKNFKEIYKGSTETTNGIKNLSYTLNENYSLIIIVVDSIGNGSGSNISNTKISAQNTKQELINLVNNERNFYESSKYSSSTTVAYMVKPDIGTIIECTAIYRGNIHVYALGDTTLIE